MFTSSFGFQHSGRLSSARRSSSRYGGRSSTGTPASAGSTHCAYSWKSSSTVPSIASTFFMLLTKNEHVTTRGAPTPPCAGSSSAARSSSSVDAPALSSRSEVRWLARCEIFFTAAARTDTSSSSFGRRYEQCSILTPSRVYSTISSFCSASSAARPSSSSKSQSTIAIRDARSSSPPS